MSNTDTCESFIPCDRSELIELCLNDSNFDEEQQQQFRDFCHILTAYYHFQFHSVSEKIKHNFSYFNPDEEKTIIKKNKEKNDQISPELIHDRKITLLKSFREILEQANYTEVSKKQLLDAFTQQSILKLDTVVNFSDFEDMVCYYRGNIRKTIEIKKWFGLKTVEREIDVLERVALLIKFKNLDEIEDEDIKQSKFESENIYVYLYKNLPKYDLEYIFPNIKIKMNAKDRFILIASAIGAAVPIVLRILPRLLLIIAIIFFVTTGKVPFKQVNVTDKDVSDFIPILLTSLSLLFTFGGFAFKQYLTYKNKHIKFQKDITETLFFRQLGVSLGVFQSIIDEAEEEECKEIILVYYHLLTSEKPLTAQQLDRKIELWLEENIGCQIDFDIESTINDLREIKGKIINNQGSLNEDDQQRSEVSLVNVTEGGYCRALSLDQAKEVIDYTWDNLFEYANN